MTWPELIHVSPDKCFGLPLDEPVRTYGTCLRSRFCTCSGSSIAWVPRVIIRARLADDSIETWNCNMCRTMSSIAKIVFWHSAEWSGSLANLNHGIVRLTFTAMNARGFRNRLLWREESNLTPRARQHTKSPFVVVVLLEWPTRLEV